MSKNRLTLIAVGAVLSFVSVLALVKPASAYINGCQDIGKDGDGYYYRRCTTTKSEEKFQVYITCVTFFGNSTLTYGNIAESGQKSRVKCGFGWWAYDDEYYTDNGPFYKLVL